MIPMPRYKVAHPSFIIEGTKEVQLRVSVGVWLVYDAGETKKRGGGDSTSGMTGEI